MEVNMSLVLMFKKMFLNINLNNYIHNVFQNRQN